MLLMDGADPVVCGGESLNDFLGPVRRAVVDHEKLEVSEGLDQDAVDCLPEIALAVVHSHKDSDLGGVFHNQEILSFDLFHMYLLDLPSASLS